MFKYLSFAAIALNLFFTTDVLFPQVISENNVRIIVIAGQSNAINIHADASYLDTSLISTSTRFYYHCGMPPDRGLPFFSTSLNTWTRLGIQRQVPYLAQHEYFFGPEITLVNRIGGSDIAVIKCAYGGSNLAADWNPDAVDGNMLYRTMMEQIEKACNILMSEGTGYSFAGFFWIQGESDASSEQYAASYYNNLTSFIQKVRADLNSPELPFIISRLPSRQPYVYLDVVRNAQEWEAGAITKVKWIDTDDLELDIDKIHFVSGSIQILGHLLGEAFTSLLVSGTGNSGLLQSESFILRQNYPNPFNPGTTISFFIPVTDLVQITLYDITGTAISEILNKELPAGKYEINFNASDLSSGIYFYKMRSGFFSDVKKMIILK